MKNWLSKRIRSLRLMPAMAVLLTSFACAGPTVSYVSRPLSSWFGADDAAELYEPDARSQNERVDGYYQRINPESAPVVHVEERVHSSRGTEVPLQVEPEQTTESMVREERREAPKRASFWPRSKPKETRLARLPEHPKSIERNQKVKRYEPKRGDVYLLKSGDPVRIFLSGIPKNIDTMDVVDEDGYITLPYLEEVYAAEKTISGFERYIKERYVNEQIYKQITVNVVLPQQEFYVRGEVKRPGLYELSQSGALSLLQAIAVAGGFTDYANPKKVKITRDGRVNMHNLKEIERNPDQDEPVQAGDIIVVPRSLF